MLKIKWGFFSPNKTFPSHRDAGKKWEKFLGYRPILSKKSKTFFTETGFLKIGKTLLRRAMEEHNKAPRMFLGYKKTNLRTRENQTALRDSFWIFGSFKVETGGP